MEDAHAIILDLDGAPEGSNAFFAVYDGHGGGTVARFAGENVHKRLLSEESYQQKEYPAALKKAFLGTDEDLLADPSHTRDPSGCTAVAALVTADGHIYVANAGDSRAVLSVKGEVKPLSFDHKPTSDVEKTRITGAGGYIEFGRVNGNLALSRALGDFEFKKNYSLSPEKQIITADPDITDHISSDEDEFIVLACDGIWDCLTSQQTVDFVRRQVADGKPLPEICENICDHCLAPDTSSGAGIGCDNMTIMIIALLRGKTTEEWYEWVKDRVEKKYGYDTPLSPPQLYSAARLNSFRARREAQERGQRPPPEDNYISPLARVLAQSGGISFLTNGGFVNDSQAATLMFGNDDSEEEDSGDEEAGEEEGSSSFFSRTLGLGHPDSDSSDPTQNLKAKLYEFEKDDSDLDEDIEMEEHSDGEAHLQGEAPPPPKQLPNGDQSTSPVPQLKSKPSGDEPLSSVVQSEGLLDGTEDPLVKS